MIKVENYLLGMDCGTTNIKAIIIGEDGKIIAEASRPSKFMIPKPNMQEQDANEWWENTKEIFHSLAEQAGEEITNKIRGISISSHTVSMLPIDADGNPVRNAMTYQDNRSSKELDTILQKIGEEEFIQIVGGQPSVSFLPSKILWFKNNEPDLFAQTQCFLQASSFINFKLTRKLTMDVDQASRTQCLDINTMKWSDKVGDVLGINLNEYLPQPVPVDDIIGFVTDDAARETGLVPGIPVVAGCSDAMASMYALGLSRLGDAGESSGTSSLVFVGSANQSKPDVPVVTKPCAVDGMPWIFDAPITTTGAAIKWFIDTMAAEERLYCQQHNLNIYNYLNELALESKPGSNGLFFFPYLLGERAPIWDEAARGMFIGMGINTTRSDIIRSIFEGTAFALRNVMETVKESGGEANILRICGGGAKSYTWSQIKASMLNIPVYLLDEASGDVPVGDALIVGYKVGVLEDLSKAVEQLIKVNDIVRPKEDWSRVYDQLYPYYVNMYQSLKDNLKSLKETMEYIY